MLLCYSGSNIIVIGDFNNKLSHLDSDNPNYKPSRSVKRLKVILDEFSLEDSWRLQHPTSRKHSWRRANTVGNPSMRQSRIDYMYICEPKFTTESCCEIRN